jgi:16S rRNA (guanine(966)-N(2))-methyltransferase RsmD
MRVISGTYRGLHLGTLKGGNLRPTSDQMRGTLFDVLGPGVEGARFLDAYAGSGAVGIEALSRGAAEVVFIEHHRPAQQLIRKNLATLGIESGYYLLRSTVAAGLERLEEEGSQFDFVFLDPPYKEISEYHHVLRLLGRSHLLDSRSLVIAEHSRHCFLEEEYGNLRRERLIRHGDAQLGFFRVK